MNNRVLMILNKYYGEDPRAQRMISALLGTGCEVDVICPKNPVKNIVNGRNLKFYLLNLTRKRASKRRYIYEYTIYLLYSILKVAVLHCRNRYGVIQIFVMPEVLMLSAFIPKLMGARILMDWMDPSIEVYLSKFLPGKLDPFPSLIRFFERIGCAISDVILVPNIGFVKAFEGRGIHTSKIAVVLNAADKEVFIPKVGPRVRTRALKLIFHGTIVKHNGLDIALRAISDVKRSIPDLHFNVIGEGPQLKEIYELVERLRLASVVNFIGRVAVNDLPGLIEENDVGIISNRSTPFTRINLPSRLFELLRMKKPVICSDLPGVRDYFDDSCVMFVEPENPQQLSRCILELYQVPEKRKELEENAYLRYEQLCWGEGKDVYLGIIEQLFNLDI